MDDPEYWVLFAKTIGNPVPEIEDDSEFVDENGVVIAESAPEPTDHRCRLRNDRRLLHRLRVAELRYFLHPSSLE